MEWQSRGRGLGYGRRALLTLSLKWQHVATALVTVLVTDAVPFGLG
jgi:hypothetical protein